MEEYKQFLYSWSSIEQYNHYFYYCQINIPVIIVFIYCWPYLEQHNYIVFIAAKYESLLLLSLNMELYNHLYTDWTWNIIIMVVNDDKTENMYNYSVFNDETLISIIVVFTNNFFILFRFTVNQPQAQYHWKKSKACTLSFSYLRLPRYSKSYKKFRRFFTAYIIFTTQLTKF